MIRWDRRIPVSAGQMPRPVHPRAELRPAATQAGGPLFPGAPRSPPAATAGVRPHALDRSAPAELHALDPERTPATPEVLEARLGADVAAIYRAAALAIASPEQRARLEGHRSSLGELYRLAAKGLFGAAAPRPMTYAAFRATLRKAGLEAELGRMLDEVDRALLGRLRAGEAAPLDLFAAHARVRADWRSSTKPITLKDLEARLAREGSIGELAEARRAMSPTEEAALASGALSPAQIAAFAREGRLLEADVLIVGAGMAGLAAANELMDRGLKVTVLEAKHEVGGRTKTDDAGPGDPIDHGAQWLHSAAENPLTAIAETLGFLTVDDDGPQLAYDAAGAREPDAPRGRSARDRVGAPRPGPGPGDPVAEGRAFEARVEALRAAWKAAADAGLDVPASEITQLTHKWDRAAAELLGPLSLGVELSQLSVAEAGTIKPETGDKLVPEGLGNVVGAFAHGVPLELGTRVQAIRHEDGRAEVVAGGQTYRAKKVLLTASTGVLASGALGFEPPLPAWKTEAFAAFPMAQFEKIVLDLDRDVLRGVPSGAHVRDLGPEGEPMELFVRPFAANRVIALTGGDFAKKLGQKTEREVIDYVLERLAKIYGPEVKQAKVKGFVSAWGQDPDVRGAWAAAQPGKLHLREDLKRPVGEVLHFAGEACHDEWAQYLPGAYLSGKAEAETMAEALGREATTAPRSARPERPSRPPARLGQRLTAPQAGRR